MVKILECSTVGDKRFSAFYAKVSVNGKFDAIENHYQTAKRFIDENGEVISPTYWKEAKGKAPVFAEIAGIQLPISYLSQFYKLLWVKYFDQNPELLYVASTYDDFSDRFKGKSKNCQADVIRDIVKKGRAHVVKECEPLIKLLRKETYIIEESGDLLDCHENIIAHQVNCQGVMGAGLAKAIKSKYPVVFEKYQSACKWSDFKDSSVLLGACQIVEVEKDKKWVANLFGQDRYGKGKQFTDYDALRRALTKLREHAEKHQLSVALPDQLGCGLAGGDWNIVRRMIEEVFHNYYVTIYKLD